MGFCLCVILFSFEIFHPHIDHHHSLHNSSIFISMILLCSQFKWKKDKTTDMYY